MYCPICWLLSTASRMDAESKMTQDPLIQEDLIIRAARLRGLTRKINELYDNPYLFYYTPRRCL
jgi:hypothetical protein